MLPNETFNKWASYHESCFRGFIPFLAETADRNEIWRQALDGYGVDELKMASYELYTKREKPPGYSSHMDAILAILKGQREASHRERENASYYAKVCGLCRNRGLVDVVAKPGHEFADQHGSRFEASRCLSVACKCAAGDKFRFRETSTREGKRWVGFDTFDAKKHEPWLVWRRRERPHPLDGEFARTARLGMRQTIAKCKELLASFGEVPAEEAL